MSKRTPIYQLRKTTEKAAAEIRCRARFLLKERVRFAVFQLDQAHCWINIRVDLGPSEIGSKVANFQFARDMGWDNTMYCVGE